MVKSSKEHSKLSILFNLMEFSENEFTECLKKLKKNLKYRGCKKTVLYKKVFQIVNDEPISKRGLLFSFTSPTHGHQETIYNCIHHLLK